MLEVSRIGEPEPPLGVKAFEKPRRNAHAIVLHCCLLRFGLMDAAF